MDWTLTVSIALYTLGLLHSVFGFYRKRKVFVKIAMGMVGVGFVFHTIALVLLGIARQHFPITNLPESLCLFAWFLSLTFLLASFRYDIKALGAFTLPLVSLLYHFHHSFHTQRHTHWPLKHSKWHVCNVYANVKWSVSTESALAQQ